MSLDNTKLLDFLEEIDKELTRRITLVAVGGTAMALLKAKPSTIDVDFTIPGEYYDEFQLALKNVPHGFTVHCFHDGAVFVNMLPDDYLKKSIPIKTKIRNIDLRALHPVDIVVTKIGRLDGRDLEDIESCINNFKLKKNQIVKRAGQLGYAANEKVFQINLQNVIKRFFNE
jgi:hypothetical protein